jgi:hypothetical protein
MEQNNGYRLASFNNSQDLLKDISRYESDMERKLGQEVVLIAYTKDSKH